MLISGSPRSGQRYLASCLLHCFVGNVEIQKVDLATISQEGHGDVTQGVTRILRGNDASHSAEATARRGSSSFARPDVDKHSRSGMACNLNADNPIEKQAVSDARMPSTSFSLAGAFKRNLPKPEEPTESSNVGRVFGNRVGASSSWMPSLTRISSAK